MVVVKADRLDEAIGLLSKNIRARARGAHGYEIAVVYYDSEFGPLEL